MSTRTANPTTSLPTGEPEGESSGARWTPGKLLRIPIFQILLVLLLICAVFGAMAPESFLAWGNIRLIIQNVSILAILGIGMTFVIVTAGIDLSIGSVLVFSGVVAAKTMQAIGGEGWGTAIVGIIVAILAGMAWGALNGFLVAKAKVPPLIVTLGTLGGALGLAQVFTGGVDIRDVPPVLIDTVGYGNLPATSIPVISVIALVLIIAFSIILHRTKFGLYTYAIGSNEESARRVGVKVDRQLIQVYALSGTLAGLAGILSLAQYGTTAIAGQSETNLNVIAAVVLGGTSLFGGIGTIFGTVVGLFIPAVLQNGFVIIGVQPFWQQVAVGAVLIAAVYIDQRRRAAASRGRPEASKLSSLRKLWSRSP
ncbi:sugar ABC transporter permease [Rhodococcus sp. WMMA185]|uniref:ABC transporter permease n=1 Tax=Rhodococcus sp. WMMA185 TaxID=679318 RepID=UPI0008790A92|nr:ABC transporter permease [Rhodococcus sp. WMMA185]AOW92007.1 sugar ABC transporter permease [Rhodococcus sp. WMMA185]